MEEKENTMQKPQSTYKRLDISSKVKRNRENLPKVFCETLRGQNSRFIENLNSVKGPMYNAISMKPITGLNQIAILMQARDHEGNAITDQRFATSEQISGQKGHLIEGCKGIAQETAYKGKENNVEVTHMPGWHVFNGKDMVGLPEVNFPTSYTTGERIKVMDNAVSRMKGSLPGQRYYAEKNNLPPLEVPERKQFSNSNDFYYSTLRNLAENNLRSGSFKQTVNGETRYTRFNKYLIPTYEDKGKIKGGEFIQGKGRVSETPQLAEDRADFRCQMATLLICQEMGITSHGFMFKDPERAERLAKAYEEHPEKLFHDTSMAGHLQEKVKEIIFEKRERINERSLTAEDKAAKRYYTYEPLDVKRIDKVIASKQELRNEYEKNRIQTAQDKALDRLNNNIKSIENEYRNEIIIPKELINQIAEERARLGRESDPAKFTHGYEDAGRKVVIQANTKQIVQNEMTHEEIINTFANGTEKDDICSKLRVSVVEKAKEKEIKLINEQRKANAIARLEKNQREKQNWKQKEIEKTNPKQKTRTRIGPDRSF